MTRPNLETVFGLMFCFCFIGCAETRIYERERDGQTHLIARIQGDAYNITVRTRRTYFHADTLNHSTPTLAGGTASAKIVSSSTGIATTIITHGSVAPSVLPGIFANMSDYIGEWLKGLFK
jgi:hypothetical protein